MPAKKGGKKEDEEVKLDPLLGTDSDDEEDEDDEEIDLSDDEDELDVDDEVMEADSF